MEQLNQPDAESEIIAEVRITLTKDNRLGIHELGNVSQIWQRLELAQACKQQKVSGF